METYILTSQAFDGGVIITDDNGRLQANFIGTTVNMNHQKYILERMSEGLEKMLSHFNSSANCKMEKLVIDFNMFWNKYDDKINSSRKRTKAKWDKMPESERTKAYYYIGKYFASIPYGTRKKFAETYLNAELWNN